MEPPDRMPAGAQAKPRSLAPAAAAVLAVLALEAAGRLAACALIADSAGEQIGPGGQGELAAGLVAAIRAAQTAAAMGCLWAFGRSPVSDLGLGARGVRRSVVAGLMFCAMLAAALAAWSFAASALDALPGISVLLGESPLDREKPAAFALGLIAMVVAGPVAEEVVFRGLVLGAISERLGSFAAISASSLLFAAAHAGGPWPVYLAGGAAFAVLRVRTGSLYGPLVAHIAGNALILLFLHPYPNFA